MCRIVLVLVIGLCVWPCDAWAFSIGPVTCPAQNRRLTPAEFAIAGEQGSFVDNITYVLSDPGEYKLAGEVRWTTSGGYLHVRLLQAADLHCVPKIYQCDCVDLPLVMSWSVYVG